MSDEIKSTEELMEDKYNCGAYDSGYCYCLERPLTDEEDMMCEYCCCAMQGSKKWGEK